MAIHILPPADAKFWKRFDSKTVRDEETGCLLWTGYCFLGYGRVALRGKQERAHRISFLRGGGVLTPEKPHVLHTCDVRNCIEFTHLFSGSNAENALDKAIKNRGSRSRKGLPYGVTVSGPNFQAQVKLRGKLRYLGEYDSWAVAAAIAAYEKNAQLFMIV